jgi:uncharacterized protein YraI
MNIQRVRRTARVGLIALLLATIAIALSATPAAAAGNYSTTGTVNVRYGPTTGYGVITTEPSGAGFTLICQ